jgi:NitT/TauT family transport system substrate-binding protein
MTRWIALVLLWLLLVPSAPEADEALRKASFVPLWTPQAQFAGYYVGLEKGIYRKHGIDLTIHPGGPGRSPADELRDGRAEFGALWLSTALQRNEAGLPLVNIAQVIQSSSMVLVARKSSGIRTVADLAGRKVGLWGGDFDIAPRAFFHHHAVRVEVVPQAATVNLFLRGGVGAASAMWYNEYHTILDTGLDPDELTVFRLDADGLNIPEDGLYALAGTIARDPDLVDAFVRASLEGWDYAFAHPDEAVDIVLRLMREAKIPANRVHQKWMLARMQEVIRPLGGGGVTGILSMNDLSAVVGELQRTGLLRDPVGYFAFARPPRASP